MKDQIKWVLNTMPKSDDRQLSIMSLENVAKARSFHRSFPQYSITPLARLDGMAKYLGLGDLFVKDESFRFGLNAFKALGGSYAMARCLSEKLGKPLEEMSFEELCAPAARRALGDITFVTATAEWPGRPGCWARRRWSTCPRGARRSGWRTSAPRAPRRRSPSITMMTRSAWRTGWRRSTAGS